ncbi:MAG: hypothetical protein ACI4XJ_02050 [Eubacteriales bacterium]
MKKIIFFILSMLLAGLLVSCGEGKETDETQPDTAQETQIETVSETEEEKNMGTPDESAKTAEESLEEAAEILNGSRFPKAKQAKVIYRISEPSELSDKLLLASVQGLAAKHTDEQIIIVAGANSLYLPYMKENWGVDLSAKVDGKSVSIQSLAEHYKDSIKGYILCSNNDGDDSIDVAVSLAGILDAAIATESNRDILDRLGYECLLDVTECDDAWLRESEYWDRLNRDIAFEQPNSMAPKLVDYAVLCGAYFNFYNGRNSAEHKAMYEFLNDNAVVFGYNNTLGEFDTVKSFSELNIQMIPSDHAYNISTLSGFPLESLTQKRASDAAADAENVHTVCFLMSDGDNMQWILNNFATEKKWYGSPLRGTFDIGWGIPPTSVELIAPMASYLYDKMTERDEFVMELSGLGYTFPSKWDSEQRQAMAGELADYMKRSDLRFAEILDDNGFKDTVVSDFTAQDGIDGLFYIEYSHYAAKNGKIIWTNGKPAVSARYRLWANNSDSSIETLAKKINSASTDPTDEKAYSFVIVHAWSGMKDGKLTDGGNTMEAIAALIEKFDDDVEVVTPSEFMDRLTANCKPE